MFRQDVRLARLMLAAILLPAFLLGQFALAETLAAPDPVPRPVLLKYLADHSTFTLVDARSATEFATSHITGAINVPHDSSDDILSSLPADPDAPIVVYCKTGKRATRLRQKLIELGFTNVRVLLPEQIAWFDGIAVFNCATPAADQSENLFTN